MRLSLLDRSRTRAGRPEAEALTGTIERAVHAESLGYDRVWVAEHHAVPGIASGSPPVLLAAVGARTRTIRLGMPVVVGGPVLDRDDVGDLMRAYRRDFRPHRGSTPSATVSLDVMVADTDAEARALALPEAWAMARSRQTGVFPPLEAVADIRSQPWTGQLRDRVEATLDRTLAGSAATVRRALERLAERTGADELMISTSTYDRAALFASDAAVREIVGG